MKEELGKLECGTKCSANSRRNVFTAENAEHAEKYIAILISERALKLSDLCELCGKKNDLIDLGFHPLCQRDAADDGNAAGDLDRRDALAQE